MRVISSSNKGVFLAGSLRAGRIPEAVQGVLSRNPVYARAAETGRSMTRDEARAKLNVHCFHTVEDFIRTREPWTLDGGETLWSAFVEFQGRELERLNVRVGKLAPANDLISPRKLEAMKVWYSLFMTLIDARDKSDAWVLEKLRKLRDQIRAEFPDAP
jgi:hypothetical protein